MAILSAYFDASGNPNNPATTMLFVSGFISTEYKWLRFDKGWRRLLEKSGVKGPFRMSKFYADFRDRPAERCAFMWAAAKLINQCTRASFSSGVDLTSHRRFQATHVLPDPEVYPYALAALKVYARVSDYFKRRNIRHQVRFVFEDGDLDRGRFYTAIDRIAREWRPNFGSKPDCPGLQAGDLLAWHHSRIARGEPIPSNDALAILGRSQPHEGRWGIHDAAWFERHSKRWPKK